MKKTYLILIGILIVLLYGALVLDQTKIIGLGEVFGYSFYVLIAAGVAAAIWLLIKPAKKVSG